VIGLAPPWRKGFELPSFLAELDEKRNLDVSMFSLELKSTQNGTGKLVIGAVDELRDHPDTIKLPVIDDPKGNFTGMWTTPIKSLSIQPAYPPHKMDMCNARPWNLLNDPS
jgi:hypothetical protein